MPGKSGGFQVVDSLKFELELGPCELQVQVQVVLLTSTTSCHGSEKKGFESATHHPSPPVGLSFGTDACMVSGSKACAPNELQGVLYPNSKKYVWPG